MNTMNTNKTATKPAPRADSIRKLTASELRAAHGGLNPQPLPPGRSRS
jgi:hypothetical protein